MDEEELTEEPKEIFIDRFTALGYDYWEIIEINSLENTLKDYKELSIDNFKKVIIMLEKPIEETEYKGKHKEVISNFLEDTIKIYKNFNKEQVKNYKKHKEIIEKLKQEIEERCEKRFERFRKERRK
jgi:hypothetical protein